jgi:hypothetical protein
MTSGTTCSYWWTYWNLDSLYQKLSDLGASADIDFTEYDTSVVWLEVTMG